MYFKTLSERRCPFWYGHLIWLNWIKTEVVIQNDIFIRCHFPMLLYRSGLNMICTITYYESLDYGDLIREYQCYVKKTVYIITLACVQTDLAAKPPITVVVDVLLTIRSQFDSYVMLYKMQGIQHCKKIQYQQHTHKKTHSKHFGVGLKSSKVSGKHLWRWKTYTISNVCRAFISAREQ